MKNYFAEDHQDYFVSKAYETWIQPPLCEMNYKLYRHLPNVNDYKVDCIEGNFICWVDNTKHIDLFPLQWETIIAVKSLPYEEKTIQLSYRLLKNREKFIKPFLKSNKGDLK